MSPISYKLVKSDTASKARAGTLTTLHGEILTPAFVPVGTKANVKGILPDSLKKIGAQVVLANTYHLYLSPGEKIVEDAGGLSRFMNWSGPTMTDSGGFQVFSLGSAFGKTITKIALGEELTREQGLVTFDEDVVSQHGQLAVIDEEGVTFTSHLDGSLHRFTPERSIEIQHALGADMFFAFDECTSPTDGFEYQKEAMERTHRWAERSLSAHQRNLEAKKKQGIFGIVQGGRFEELRKESAIAISSMDFDGFGIGGSFSKEDMQGALQAAIDYLPSDKPRHFLGIGEPLDILTGIKEGMDLFDCVAATRLGRHGTIYTREGTIVIKKEKYQREFTSLLGDTEGEEVSSPIQTVQGTEGFTRAYLSHLFRSNEILGQTIASLHNLGFIIQLVDGARRAIHEGKFLEYREEFLRKYQK